VSATGQRKRSHGLNTCLKTLSRSTVPPTAPASAVRSRDSITR
jgi:hypothetical protein